MYPQSAYRKGGVFNLRLNTPVAKATSLFRKRNSEPLTAPSAEGAFRRTSCKASPERGGAREAGGGVHPPPRTSAAALSAAVDSRKLQETAPNTQAEPTPQKQPPQTPAALREKGSGEEGLLSEKPPPPQNSPCTVSSGGSAREGLLSEKPPPSHTLVFSYFPANLTSALA